MHHGKTPAQKCRWAASRCNFAPALTLYGAVRFFSRSEFAGIKEDPIPDVAVEGRPGGGPREAGAAVRMSWSIRGTSNAA